MRANTRKIFFSSLLGILLLFPLLQKIWPNLLHSPTEISITAKSQVLSPPSLNHWCGTDDRGRDVFSRLVFGIRNSLLYCGSACAIIVFLGYIIGSLLGLAGSRFDFCAQRLIEIWSLLPSLQIALLLLAVFSSAWALFLVWCLFGWVSLSQYVRLDVLKLKHSHFVEASRNMGASFCSIFFHDILPNATAPLLSLGPLIFANLLLTLTSLDYLGLGLPPPTPNLGELLSQAKDNLEAWWLFVFPLVSLLGILGILRMNSKPLYESSARILEEKSVHPFPKTARVRFQEWVTEH